MRKDTKKETSQDNHKPLPADVQATIARGRAAFEEFTGCPDWSAATSSRKESQTIISIVDPGDVEQREQRLKDKEERAKGRRGQPPQTDRLRTITTFVEHLEREGVPFATARKSRMNKLVRAWMNERMQKGQDSRKSRQGTIGEDAVTDLLKQVDELRK